MKNNILLLMAMLMGGFAIAQEENGDTTRLKIGKYEFIIIGSDTINVDEEDEMDEDHIGWTSDGINDELTYWSGFDVGINLPVNGNFENNFTGKHLQIDPSQSFVFSFNFAEQRIRIVKDYFGIVTGLGFTNSRYGFKDNQLRLSSNADSTFGVVDSSLFNGFTKNQLRVNTLNVPLLFQINTSKNEDKNFHLSFGAIGGVRIGSNVKYKFDTAGGGESKNKIKGRYNLNAFQLNGTVRMGYKDFGLFANYNVLSLYEKNKSEIAYPLSFGASFHF